MESHFLGFIYFLQNPNTGEIFYVGATQCSLNNRLRTHYQHLREFERGLRKENSRYRYLQNLRPDKAKIVLLETVYSKEKLDEREIFYISHFRELNPNLTNMTNGGSGGYTAEFYEEGETIIFRNKISMVNKGRPKPEGFAENMSKARMGINNPAAKLIKNGGIIATKDKIDFIWFKYGFEVNEFFSNKYAYGNANTRLNNIKSTLVPRVYGYEIKYFNEASKRVQDIVQSQRESVEQ